MVPTDLAAAARDAGADPLTQRERDTLRLVDEGLSNKEIAIRLALSPGTVRNYLSERCCQARCFQPDRSRTIARLNGGSDPLVDMESLFCLRNCRLSFMSAQPPLSSLEAATHQTAVSRMTFVPGNTLGHEKMLVGSHGRGMQLGYRAS